MPYRGEYLILITNPALTVVGDPIISWTTLDVTLRFNEPDSGLFIVPGYSWIRDMMTPGNRAVVIRNQALHGNEPGTVVTAGPIEKTLYERADDGENAGVGTLTVNFAGDMAHIAGRLTYPNPALAPAAQNVDVWTATAVNAETILRNLVNLNAGPGALAARRIPQLVLGSVAGVGSTVTVKTERMEPLPDVLRRVALAGGDLGFRTVQVGSTIEFQVYAPVDKSNQVRFSFDMGNIKYLSYEVVAPVATTAIVGGQGDGVDRALIERVSTAAESAWGRLETLVSRAGSTDVAELQTDGDNTLLDDAETARVSSNIVDTAEQRYGIHYDLGTKVAIEQWPGSQIVDVVRTVHLQAWPTAGEVISATVGSQAARPDPDWIHMMREIDRRVGRLERVVVPAVP